MAERPELFIVADGNGKTVSFGKRQAMWLQERGEIERTETQFLWRSRALTAEELDALVLEQPELRECDFCCAWPSGWEIHLRHPVHTAPPAPGPIKRQMFACDTCAGFIKTNQRAALVDYAIDTIRAEKAPHVDPAIAREALRPRVRYVVDQMFSARRGPPEQMAA